MITGPKDDSDVPFTGVCHQLTEVDFGHHLHQVGLLVHGPPFVEDHVFDAVPRSEVDIVLVGLVVDAGLEVHAVEIPVVPPVPRHLSGPDPRCVFDPGFGRQTVDHVVVEQLAVLPGDDDRAPRKRPLADGRSDVPLTFAHEHLQPVVPSLLLALGIGGENAAQFGRFAVAAQVEPRIAFEIGLRYDQFVASVELDERREEDQPSGVELRDPGRGVGVLERVEELALEIEIPAACDIGYDGPAIRWEGEGNAFVPDAERALPVGGEAVGQSVVVETEDKAEVAAEREHQLVVTLPDPAFLVEGRGDRPIDGALFRPDDTGVPPEHLAVFEGHGDGRRSEQRRVAGIESYADLLPDGHRRAEVAVRRGQRIDFLCREGRGDAGQAEHQQKRFEVHSRFRQTKLSKIRYSHRAAFSGCCSFYYTDNRRHTLRRGIDFRSGNRTFPKKRRAEGPAFPNFHFYSLQERPCCF